VLMIIGVIVDRSSTRSEVTSTEAKPTELLALHSW
jgi:hypothetical protein